MGHGVFENHRMGHFLVIHRRKWDMGCLDTYKWDTGWPSSAENWTWEFSRTTELDIGGWSGAENGTLGVPENQKMGHGLAIQHQKWDMGVLGDHRIGHWRVVRHRELDMGFSRNATVGHWLITQRRELDMGSPSRTAKMGHGVHRNSKMGHPAPTLGHGAISETVILYSTHYFNSGRALQRERNVSLLFPSKSYLRMWCIRQLQHLPYVWLLCEVIEFAKQLLQSQISQHPCKLLCDSLGYDAVIINNYC